MDSKSIDFLHRGKTGKVSDKWASYLPYYDSIFYPLRNESVRLLEIGVQNGGSLDTWASYFQSAKALVGCDIDHKCGELKYDDERIKIIVADINSDIAYRQVTAISSQFEIIIDDGSHQANDILGSFCNYFSLLSPGGIYVVEDAHCLYMNEFGGGILNENSPYAFFKKLLDVVSFQFWENEININTYLRTFFDLQEVPKFILDGWVDSIEFRNSIITIRKALRPGHDKLGDRLTVGHLTQVQDWGGRGRPG